MTAQSPDVRRDRPIGYWIKHIDRAVEEDFARLLAAEGLNRRAWQVVNTLAQAPATGPRLDAALAPFLTADEPTVAPYADALAARGWAVRTAGVYALTAGGTEAHTRIAALVRAARARIVDGLTADDYAELLRLLQRVAANLGVEDAGE
ncbi:MAG TPA: MarR family transcriptional regulator [Streptosporangiaceae bacterium]|jgi:DNA-binding MarR family transcriptional regulator